MPGPPSATLVVYGDLPEFRAAGADGKQGRLVFDGRVNHHNRPSFERLLIRELGALAGRDLEGATVRQLRTVFELQKLVRERSYSSVIFYGHTITLSSSGPAAAQQELALAGAREFMNSRDFANALKAGGVREAIIAGCSSVSLRPASFRSRHRCGSAACRSIEPTMPREMQQQSSTFASRNSPSSGGPTQV